MGQLEQITASAGSGKTYTLIRRFLELLAGSGQEGELALRDLAAPGGRPHAWPEILAATFTNAAASEMKERLVRELKKYALAPEGQLTINNGQLTIKNGRRQEDGPFAPNADNPTPTQDDSLSTLPTTNPNHPQSGFRREGVRGREPQGAQLLGVPSPGDVPLFTAEQAEERLDAMLRRFGSLNIRTIDSLLTMLVRLSALDLGLPPDFQPVFDDALPLQFELFFDETQERARAGDEELRGLLLESCALALADDKQGGFMAPAALAGTILKLIAHIWRHGNLKHPATRETLAAAARDLRQTAGRAATALQACIEQEELDCDKRFLGILDKIAALATAPNGDNPTLTQYDNLSTPSTPNPNHPQSGFRRGEGPGEGNLKGLSSLGFPSPGDAALTSKYLERPALAACLNKKSAAASDEAETAFSLLQFACGRAAGKLAKLREAARILPYTRLAARLAGPFRAWLAERGLLPAELLGGYARDILERDQGPSEAYCRLGARLTHLLMDEFQDTSREQWRAIAPLAAECLAGGGGVVYVGDVKQAIYGWRGGDAALFQEIAADPELTAIAGPAQITTLPANWRSLGRIVELNNTVFGGLGQKETALSAAAALLGPDCPPDIVAETARDLLDTFNAAVQDLPPEREADRERGYVRLVRLGGAVGGGEPQGDDPLEVPAFYRIPLTPPSWRGFEGKIPKARFLDFSAARRPPSWRPEEISPPEPRLAGLGEDGDIRSEDGVEIYYANQTGEPAPRPFPDIASGEPDLSGYADLTDNYRAIYHRLRPLLLDDILARRRPGEVAILTRGNSSAQMLARWLTAWGVPTITENSLLLNDHPLIRQIIAFLKFMDNPLDDPALFEFLCSEDIFLPMSGLSARELHDWLLGLQGRGEHLLIAARRDFPEAWTRFAAPFYQQAGLMSGYDLVREMLEHFEVWQRRPEDAVFLRRFLELLHGAEARDMKSLPEFLEWWQAPGTAEKLPVAESLDAVRIMTVHKAKGLEFPVVIAPFNDFKVSASDDFTRADLPGGEALLVDRKPVGAPYFRNLSRQAREALHLVYVAWTRASEELYAFLPPAGTENDADAPEKRRGGGSSGVPVSLALDILLEDLPFDANGVYEAGEQLIINKGQWTIKKGKGTENTPNSSALTPNTTPPHHPQSGLRRERGSGGEGTLRGLTPCGSLSPGVPFAPMAWLPRLKIYRNAREGQGQAARERGVLIHNCLENLHFSGTGQEEIYAAALDAFMHARRVLNLPRLEEGLYQEIMDLLMWALSLPEAALWFADGRPEQEILTADGARKIADRLVSGPDGDVILEYKTGGLDLPPEALPLPEHVVQLRRYLELVSHIRNRPAQGNLIYLDRREVYSVTLEEAAT